MPAVALVSNNAQGECRSRLRWALLLRQRGHQVRYVVPTGDDAAAALIQSHGIPVDRYPLDRLSPGLVTGARTVAALVDIFSRQAFDIVHTFAHEPNIYGAIAARLASVPVLVTQVTGLGRLFADDRVRSQQTFAQRSLVRAYRMITRLSTAVVFHNHEDARVLGYGFAARASSKAMYLTSGSGVDVDAYSPATVTAAERAAVRAEFGFPGDAVVITSVARLVRHKGIHQLMAAARQVTARFPQARFLIVGGADEGNRRSLQMTELQEQAGQAVTLAGERGDIRRLLAATDIFVNPSLREGLPRATLEAMAMGKPVVALAVAGSRETVQEGVNGHLTPLGDAAALASALSSLVGDAALREKMGDASRRRAVERFRVESSVERIAELYEDCLAAGRRQRRPAMDQAAAV